MEHKTPYRGMYGVFVSVFYNKSKGDNMGKIAFMYPGQGMQKIGMGQSFYENSQAAKAVFELADQVLDFSLKKICFEENDAINETQYIQPALVTTCLAMTEEIEKRGLLPDVTLGLSLGEYVAIAVAGGFSMEDVIRTVRARGLYMAEACSAGKGVMYSVLGLEAGKIEKLLVNREQVFVANYQCPMQTLISGEEKAVENMIPLLEKAGAKKCIPLKLSGAFHSPLLKKAGDQLAEYLKGVEIKDLKIPYVTNVTGELVYDKAEVKELLKKHLFSAVRFEQSVRRLIDADVRTFIEIGPGKTVSGFVKKIDKTVTVINIETMEDLEKLRMLYN